MHSTYDLLLQHDVVIAGELGVREARQPVHAVRDRSVMFLLVEDQEKEHEDHEVSQTGGVSL